MQDLGFSLHVFGTIGTLFPSLDNLKSVVSINRIHPSNNGGATRNGGINPGSGDKDLASATLRNFITVAAGFGVVSLIAPSFCPPLPVRS